jgi:hypothetical protein
VRRTDKAINCSRSNQSRNSTRLEILLYGTTFGPILKPSQTTAVASPERKEAAIKPDPWVTFSVEVQSTWRFNSPSRCDTKAQKQLCFSLIYHSILKIEIVLQFFNPLSSCGLKWPSKINSNILKQVICIDFHLGTFHRLKNFPFTQTKVPQEFRVFLWDYEITSSMLPIADLLTRLTNHPMDSAEDAQCTD